MLCTFAYLHHVRHVTLLNENDSGELVVFGDFFRQFTQQIDQTGGLVGQNTQRIYNIIVDFIQKDLFNHHHLALARGLHEMIESPGIFSFYGSFLNRFWLFLDNANDLSSESLKHQLNYGKRGLKEENKKMSGDQGPTYLPFRPPSPTLIRGSSMVFAART